MEKEALLSTGRPKALIGTLLLRMNSSPVPFAREKPSLKVKKPLAGPRNDCIGNPF